MWLNVNHVSILYGDHAYPNLEVFWFPEYDWTEFSSDMEKPIAPNTLEPLRMCIDLWMIIDSVHACDQCSHQFSRTGFLVSKCIVPPLH